MDRNVRKTDVDNDWTNVFINTIVKNIQTVCNGIIPFSQNIEVIGHLYLSIDSGKKVNYIVNEKCSKQDTFVNSTSESFHAEPKPKPTRGTPRSRKKKASPSKTFESPAKSMKFCESFDMKGDTAIDEVLDDISVDSSLGVTFTEHHSHSESRHFLTETGSATIDQHVLTIENMEEGSKIENQNSGTDINQLQVIKTEDEASTSNVPEFYFDPNNPEATLCVIATDDCKSNIEAYYAGNLNMEGDTTLDESTSDLALDNQSLNETDTNYDPEIHEYDVTEDNIRLLRTVNNDKVKESEVEYTIVEMGTKQGKPMLVDNIGYRYTLRKTTDACIRWWCSKRSKTRRCPAAIAQRGESFVRGQHEHVHDAEAGLLTSTIIRAEARNQALNDQFTPPSEVIERALSVKGCNNDESLLPKEQSLLRMINYCRKDKKIKKESPDIE